MTGRPWRAYDPDTGTHLATGVEPDEPPPGARVVHDDPTPPQIEAALRAARGEQRRRRRWTRAGDAERISAAEAKRARKRAKHARP